MDKPIKVICFSGQIAAAKDTAADHLAERLNAIAGCKDTFDSHERYADICWHRSAFGNAVKDTYMDTFGVDRAFVEKWKRKEAAPPGFLKNVRSSLQWIGDGFRQINPNIWVDVLFHKYHGKNVIISDGRYLSEVEAVTKRGGINVVLWRPHYENNDPHPSESQLKAEIDKLKGRESGAIDDSIFDYFIVNDGSIKDLYKKVDDLIPFVEKWWGM